MNRNLPTNSRAIGTAQWPRRLIGVFLAAAGAIGSADSAAAEMVTIRIGSPPVAAGKSARGGKPATYVLQADKAPGLDGALDEAVWQKAPALKLARTLDGSAAAAQPTTVRLCRHDGTLYVAVEAVEPLMDRLRATRRGHDGQIWEDDSIEIFLGTGGQYWHIGVNAVGSTYDGKAKDSGWNAGPGLRASAGRGRSAWTLEIAIPLKALAGEGKLPTDWIANFNRNRYAAGAAEESSWSPTYSGDSHQPERFGRMLLQDPPAEQPEVVRKDALTVLPTETGQGVLKFDLSALPRGAKVFRADLRVFRTAAVDGQFDEALVDVEVYPLTAEFEGKGTPKAAGEPLAIRGPWFDRLDATEAVRAWAAGKPNGGVFVKACPFLNAGAACLDIAYEGKPQNVPPQVKDVTAEHRNGQTFITWTEVTDPVGRDDIQWGPMKMILDDLDRKQRVRYVVYRHSRAITAANLHEAAVIAEVPPASAWNVNGRSLERGIDWNLANKYAHMHGHWNPFGEATMDGEWGRDCPIDRLVIADGGKPLARTTGLYVHTPAADGQAYYAVVAQIDGVENTRDVGAGNTAGAVAEKVGEPEPVFQGELPPVPFWNYPEKRRHYVRWVTEPYANVPSQYYNWTVAVPEELGKSVPLELHLHSWSRSYWRTPYRIERDSIAVMPHDFPLQTWWYGYHSSHGTLKGFKQGAIQPYTERRVLWFLDWVMRKWPVDKSRVLVTAINHVPGGPGPGDDGAGPSGAVHLAFRHPQRFTMVLPGQFRASYAPAPAGTMQAIWGKPDWALKTPDGGSVWEELDLPVRVAGYKAGTDLPLLTALGRQVPKDVSALIGECLGRGGAVLTFYDQWPTPHLIPVSAGATWPAPMIRMDVRKDRLLPTFSRTSAASFRGEPPTYPRLNLGFRFDAGSVVDEPARLEVAIWRERGSGPASADVTLTRVQRFKPAAGQVCTWQMGDKSGEVAVGTDGLITIPNCPMPDRPARLVVVPK